MKRTAALQLGWLASQAPSALRFRRALRDPEGAQLQVLRGLKGTLGGSAYGRQVGFARVQTLADLGRLPILEPADLAPWVARIAAGETGVLTTEPVEVLEPTGGTTGRKLIPITARLRSEFAAAVAPWMVALHRDAPGLIGTRSYWSISRAVRVREVTSGGVPVGFDDDASYFGPLARRAIRALMAVDREVARAPSMEDWRRATAIGLLECRDLGLISVWSPTFLTVLLDAIARDRDLLEPLLSADARSRLRAAGPELHGRVLWPRLAVISAWADGFAASHLPALRARFDGVRFQAKGLLATEGVVSFPWGAGEGHVLALTSHVLELRDLTDGRVLPAHQGRIGGTYQPLLTTGGGLVRYALPDAVEVVGMAGAIPRIRLLGRLDHGSDLVGEKLTPGGVEAALATLWDRRPSFAMLVPDGLRYVLVVDGAPIPADALDAALRAAYHYAYARDLGQLGPPDVRCVPDAWTRWERAIEAQSLTLGDQKPGALETRPAVVQALLA